jgi:hypothetical protein
MRAWLRVVLPPPWVVGLTATIYFSVQLFFIFIWYMHSPGPDRWGWEQVVEALHTGNQEFQHALLAIMTFGYAAFRANAFHPMFRPAYRDWLRTTPWTPAQPLPLGPVHLVLQDAVVLLPIGVAASLAGAHPAMIPLVFLSFYLTIAMASSIGYGGEAFGYPLAAGLGLIAYFIEQPWMALGSAVAVYPLAYGGLRATLDRLYRWHITGDEELRPPPISQTDAGRSERTTGSGNAKLLGWPYNRIQPRRMKSDISGRDRMLLSLLIGWWVYAASEGFDSVLFMRPEEHQSFCNLLTYAVVALRMGAYCIGYMPPISLWGRIATFRWIIPGYDVVFIAPACILLIGRLLPAGLLAAGLSLNLSYSLTLSALLLAANCLGPSLDRWRLTGNHRIVPAEFGQSETKRV